MALATALCIGLLVIDNEFRGHLDAIAFIWLMLLALIYHLAEAADYANKEKNLPQPLFKDEQEAFKFLICIKLYNIEFGEIGGYPRIHGWFWGRDDDEQKAIDEALMVIGGSPDKDRVYLDFQKWESSKYPDIFNWSEHRIIQEFLLGFIEKTQKPTRGISPYALREAEKIQVKVLLDSGKVRECLCLTPFEFPSTYRLWFELPFRWPNSTIEGTLDELTIRVSKRPKSRIRGVVDWLNQITGDGVSGLTKCVVGFGGIVLFFLIMRGLFDLIRYIAANWF
jgi:hypothetical protein